MVFHIKRGLPATCGRKTNAIGIMLSMVVIFFALVLPGYAHRLVLFAWIDGCIVHTQSKFHGGSKVFEGDITVFNNAGQELLTGKTDRQGAFSFPLKTVQSPSALKIVLNAGMGHQAHWNLTGSEVLEARGLDSDTRALTGNNRDDLAGKPERMVTSQAGTEEYSPCRMKEAELRKIIEETVDRKMSPVMDTLIDIREEIAIGLDDVVAGLGYILGVTGLLAWFYARKKE